MTLHTDPIKPRVIERALLGTDLDGVVRILATHSVGIRNTVEGVGTDADECELIDASRECQEAGLYLWEGTSRLELESWDAPFPTEVVYDGSVRPVRPDEVGALYAMHPPEDEG